MKLAFAPPLALSSSSALSCLSPSTPHPLPFRSPSSLPPTPVRARSTSPCATLTSPSPSPSAPPPVTKETPVHRSIPYLTLFYEILTERSLLLSRSSRHGPVYRSRFPSELCVIITTHALCASVLEDEHLFRSRGANNPSFRAVFGNDTVHSESGLRSKFERRELTRSLFSGSLLPNYYQVAQKGADRLVSVLLNSPNHDTTDVDLTKEARLLATRVILSAYDSEAASDDEKKAMRTLRKFEKLLIRISKPVFLPPIPYLLSDATQAQREMAELLLEPMSPRIKWVKRELGSLKRESEEKFLYTTLEYPDFFTSFIAMSCRVEPYILDLPDEQFAVEIMRSLSAMLFGGFATTAPAIAMCIQVVYCNENLLHVLRNEQRGVNEVTLKAINEEMPILNAVMLEILRLYPSATVLPRRANVNTVVDGHAVKKDELVMLDVLSAHHDERVFENADTFDYTRFLDSQNSVEDGSNNKRKKNTVRDLLLFSSHKGHHYCLGASFAKMEMMTTLATLLRNVDVKLKEENMANGMLYLPHVEPKNGVFARGCVAYDLDEA